MPEAETDLLAAVDALIAGGGALPDPAERRRLREAHGLTQADVARALDVAIQQVRRWESGEAAPRPPQRGAYQRLLAKLAELYPAAAVPGEHQDHVPAGSLAVPAAVRAAVPARLGRLGTPRDASAVPKTSRKPSVPVGKTSRTSPGPAKTSDKSAAAATGGKFAVGPLVVLDGDGRAYGAGGLVLDCPASTVVQLVEWALAQDLGAERLHQWGRDVDPLVVLTAAACERLGVPVELEDRRELRLPVEHPVVRDVLSAGWLLTKRGFGPWARIYQTAEGRRRRCVQLAIVPWEALEDRAWPGTAQMPAPELAAALTVFAERVLTPCGSTAVVGLQLMEALRPPTRAVKAEDGSWASGPVAGSLTQAVDPAPPEAPAEHPVAFQRAEEDELLEEAHDWIRPVETLSDAECQLPYAVGIDVNLAFAAASNRLLVGLDEPQHVTDPAFDPKAPGAWLVDLSDLDLDERLPSPFTPDGTRPTGPAWYATPTVAYAAELGHQVQPTQAWIRTESIAYLDPWYARLRDAYLATMADLGITKDLPPEAFLEAMATYKSHGAPAALAVLAAIKSTCKGGIGKLRERPQGLSYTPGARWAALARPTWRPDIRAAVIAAARVNAHRKMTRLAAATGQYPLAVMSDCVVYPAAGPSPLDVLPHDATGKPAVTGSFRIGVSPGMVKHEGTQSVLWAVGLLEAGENPARYVKTGSHLAGDE